MLDFIKAPPNIYAGRVTKEVPEQGRMTEVMKAGRNYLASDESRKQRAAERRLLEFDYSETREFHGTFLTGCLLENMGRVVEWLGPLTGVWKIVSLNPAIIACLPFSLRTAVRAQVLQGAREAQGGDGADAGPGPRGPDHHRARGPARLRTCPQARTEKCELIRGNGFSGTSWMDESLRACQATITDDPDNH